MVTRPTIALIGERGPEAVVPLHKAQNFGFPGGGGGGGGVNVAINIAQMGGGFAELPADQQARLVGDAYARQVRSSGGLRAIQRRQSRGL